MLAILACRVWILFLSSGRGSPRGLSLASAYHLIDARPPLADDAQAEGSSALGRAAVHAAALFRPLLAGCARSSVEQRSVCLGGRRPVTPCHLWPCVLGRWRAGFRNGGVALVRRDWHAL